MEQNSSNVIGLVKVHSILLLIIINVLGLFGVAMSGQGFVAFQSYPVYIAHWMTFIWAINLAIRIATLWGFLTTNRAHRALLSHFKNKTEDELTMAFLTSTISIAKTMLILIFDVFTIFFVWNVEVSFVSIATGAFAALSILYHLNHILKNEDSDRSAGNLIAALLWVVPSFAGMIYLLFWL